MTLILCPECGREVSNQANTCPDCAFPLHGATSIGPDMPRDERSALVLWKSGVSVATRVILGGLLMAGAAEIPTAEWGSFIGGLVIFGSAVPALLRGRVAWLRAKGPGAASKLMEARMVAMDEHYRERIDRLEQMHSAQLTDLEERLDFAERILPRQRPVTPIP